MTERGTGMNAETDVTPSEPTANRKGHVLGASWTYLLPSLELGRVLCIGRPSAPALETLQRHARSVAVVGPDALPGPEEDATFDLVAVLG
ncbi:MAG: hypothetical protein M3R01_05225, partial [Actinomycetota bacterium]|nr:hypothetical protein [Actinomycetota bacterium]